MTEGKRRDDLLVTFAKDTSLNIFERRLAVKYMRAGQLKNDLLAELKPLSLTSVTHTSKKDKKVKREG